MKIFQRIWGKTLLAGLLTMGLLTSCSLDEDPESLVLEESIEDSEDGVDYWVTGVYSKYVYDMFCWGYFPRVLEFDADYVTGPDWFFNKFGQGEFQAEPDVTDALWKGCYGLIERANNALRHIRAMKNVDAEVKNNAIGEMYFHKALAYFLLVRAYGDVPIVPEEVQTDYNNARRPVAEVYSHIRSLLVDASNLLYVNSDSRYERGHVAAGSAVGLLVKMLCTEASAAMPAGTQIVVHNDQAYDTTDGITTRRILGTKVCTKTAVSGYESLDHDALYAEAVEWGDKLLAGDYGTYALSDFDRLWSRAGRYDSEFLFQVYVPNNDPTYKTSVHTQYSGYMTATGSDVLQNGKYIGCTYQWYQLFEKNDRRVTDGVVHRWRNYTMLSSGDSFYYPDDDTYNSLRNEWSAEDGINYYCNKSYQCIAFTTKYSDVTDDAIENADSPWPFLRLADVYLMLAEAKNETGDKEGAIALVNQVRQRSNASAWQAADKTQEGLRSDIIEERARELACEADRRWDIIRWGIYLEAMNQVVSDDSGLSKLRSARHLLYPIPTQEINTNKAINQNPGWQ